MELKDSTMSVAAIRRLRTRGVAVWLDTLSRDLLETGGFRSLIDDLGVSGATSNPTIFERAICGSDRYDSAIADAVSSGFVDPEGLLFALACEDVRRAAAELRPIYDASNGTDGFVSLQCSPDRADDVDAT